MMLPVEFAYMIGMDRHRERLRMATMNRRFRRIGEKQKRDNLYSYLLVWLGCRLVVWGRHLEDRYGTKPRPLHSRL